MRMTAMQRDKQKTEKVNSANDVREINKIPDYDWVFRDSAKKGGNGKGVVGGLLKKDIWKIILSFFLYVIKNSPVYIIPIVSAAVIDEIAAVGGPDTKKLIIYAAIMLVSLIQNVPMHVLYAKITDGFLRNTSAGIKETVIRKLQRLSITYHTEMETGKLQSKFLLDTERVEQYLRMIFYSFIPTCISLAVNVGITLYQSPIVALFFVVVVPVNLFLTKYYSKPMVKSFGDLRRENENLSARLTRMLEMLQVTKAHGLESEEIERLDADIRRVTRRGLEADRMVAQFGSYSWVITQFFNGLCLFFTVIMAIKGVPGFTIGSITLFQSLFGQINGGISSVINSFPQMATGRESIRSLSEIMNSDDVEITDGKTKLPSVEGDVEFDHVYYRYPDKDEYVIKDLCLKVKKGECMAFVGASGSGKSTVMNMIIGFLKPTEGELLIDGKNICDLDLPDYRSNLSVVPQNSVLFEGSIRENIYRRAARGRRPTRRRKRISRRNAERARFQRRRTWRKTLGRAETANRDRPRAHPRSAHSHSRRSDFRARQRFRISRSESDRKRDQGKNDLHRRAQTVHHSLRRPHRMYGKRSNRRTRNVRRTYG